LAVLAARQHGVVAAWQLLRIGFTRKRIEHRLRVGRLHCLFRGVYAVGHPAVTHEGRWMAAVLAAGRGTLLSHRDAAALWEMADYTGPAIEVTVPGTGSREVAGLRIHRTRRLHPPDIASHRSIPATSPPRTLFDLAAVLAPRHLELALEEGLRSGVVSPDAVKEQVERNAGRGGAPVLRDLLGGAPDGLARTKSRLEAQFLRFCGEEALPRPVVNTRVAGYEVDAHWPGTNVIVELDSWEFHRGRAAFERDRAKWAELTAAGYRVVVVTHRRLVQERSKLAATLRALLAS
jgi:very-short-patch-repair endonuclease